MKILLFGASGSGTTTLAREISKRTGIRHLDVDDYYWRKTSPPFQEKLPLSERNENLKKDIKNSGDTLVSGSLVKWGKEWEDAFDLAIFIRLTNTTRMDRLKKREIQRYGDRLLTDPELQRISQEFLSWAERYEDPDFDGRSLNGHEHWISKLSCKVVRLDGEIGIEDNLEQVLSELGPLDIRGDQVQNPSKGPC